MIDHSNSRLKTNLFLDRDAQLNSSQQENKFEAQTAVYTTAFYGGTALDDASFGFVIVPSDGVSLEEAEAALDQAIVEFLKEGVDLDKLNRLKRQFRASEIYARDSVSGLANAYGAALTSGLSLDDIHEWPNILQAVTQDDIMAAAKLVLPAARTLLLSK